MSSSSDEHEVNDEDELLMHNEFTLPDNCKKYWKKRYDLFSKFDNGVYMTSELWFSVTPEPVAKFTSQFVRELLPRATTIVDLCCGGGGNTIQFASTFDSVGAIDINPVNVKCTMHNANIYGVHDKIWPVTGDWNQISQNGGKDWIPSDVSQIDLMFCSPPWGGPKYSKNDNEFDLLDMSPFPLEKLLLQMSQYSRNLAVFLPRSLNLDQLRSVTKKLFGAQAKCRVVYLYLRNHCPGLIAFFGEEVASQYVVYTEDIVGEDYYG